MTGEKIGFLLAGSAFSILTALADVKRSWYAPLTINVMYFNRDQRFRDAKLTRQTCRCCRIGARRLAPADSNTVATCPPAVETLRVLRNQAL